MSTRLVIEGNAVYEIDEDCQACSKNNQKEKKVSESSVKLEKKVNKENR